MGDKQLLTNKSLSKLSSSKPSSSRLKDDQKDSLMVEIPDVETTIRKSADKFKKMVASTKQTAGSLKKSKGKGKEIESIKDVEENPLIWDDTLASLELTKKRQSVVRREIGFVQRVVRMQLPPPYEYDTVIVKKSRQKLKFNTYTVMKPAQADMEMKQMYYLGPRCNKNGEILPHSILGDLETFVREAEERGQFKEIQEAFKCSRKQIEAEDLAKVIPSPKIIKNPKLDEDKALKTWDAEMKERKSEMKRLSGILGRPEKHLLMTRTDDYAKVFKGRELIAFAQADTHPDSGFWKLQDSLGHHQIRTTLTKRERGIISTPAVTGDAASIREQKGALREPFDSSWFKSSYLKEKDEQLGGVIKIDNQLLFEGLEICGKSVTKQQNSPDDTTDNTDYCSPDGDASRIHCHKDLDLIEEERFTGPCLKIEDEVLKWVKEEDQRDKTAKTTYILIEGFVNETACGHICLNNCGTTVLKYSWTKLPEFKPLPIPRPQRQPFFLNDHDGVILPGDTAKVEVHFRSKIPGYFSETWLLHTIPLIAAGAEIKFVLKGVARQTKEFTQECLLLEEMLKKRQTVTLCSYLVKEIVDEITLKAHLKYIKQEAVPPSVTKEKMFAEANPGLHYHAYIVNKLTKLYCDLMMEVTGCTTPYDIGTLSVFQLTKLIRSLPEPESDCESGEVNLTANRKQMLLLHLNQDVTVLSFQPVTPFLSASHYRYIMCYKLLTNGVEDIVDLASYTAEYLGLVTKEVKECETDAANLKKEQKVKSKTTVNSAKPKGKKLDDKKLEDHNDQIGMDGANAQKTPVESYSPVYKYRSCHSGYNPALNLYDEKVYIMMYNMFNDIVYKMSELFETF